MRWCPRCRSPRVRRSLPGISVMLARWMALPLPVYAMIAAVIVMLACHASGMKDAAKLAGYVSAIVVLDHASEPWLYALHRFLETVLGLAVAVGVSLVPKLLRVKAPQPPAR